MIDVLFLWIAVVRIMAIPVHSESGSQRFAKKKTVHAVHNKVHDTKSAKKIDETTPML